ncbi:MAG: M24 family metallopeptidase [Anaerolineae bacterium]|nr:M24 family metallopeptidase [Anaerolineae bacterium]NUQ06708.1 M24 family metallopeptidase [Anaerolineae bacterium]
MKSDLDGLMERRGLDAFLAFGDEGENPVLYYLTNGAHITKGYALKRRGGDLLLVVNAMEIEEAAKSGLNVISEFDLGYAQLLRAAEGDQLAAAAQLVARMLARIGLEGGRVGVYGRGAINYFVQLHGALTQNLPAYTFVGESGVTLFDEAAITKDAEELARLRSVSARTSEVLRETWDFIAGHRLQGGVVVNDQGEPLTIGAVKRFVRRALFDRDLEDTDMIFAQGRDGGFPHSRGEAAQPLRAGQAVVFDLFPRELGGGYHHDCTRTWSIGYAAPEVQEAYNQVMDAFEIAVDSFRVNMPTRALQEAVQSYFEAHGHPTSRSHPGTTVGYMHSLGHGVGINIHERPSLSHLSNDVFAPGSVISIEPGLYYPERGFGVRIEDLVYVGGDGQLITLTDFHKELVLPLKG